MSRALAMTNLAIEGAPEIAPAEEARSREASGLGEALRRMAQDAATDPEGYLAETIVPEGGE